MYTENVTIEGKKYRVEGRSVFEEQDNAYVHIGLCDAGTKRANKKVWEVLDRLDRQAMQDENEA